MGKASGEVKMLAKNRVTEYVCASTAGSGTRSRGSLYWDGLARFLDVLLVKLHNALFWIPIDP